MTTAVGGPAEPVLSNVDRGGTVDGGTEPPGQRRREFVRTFVEHSWTRPGAERPAARPHIVLAVATLAAVVALGAGVVLQLIRPVALPKASSAPAAQSPTTAGYSAVAGWDCLATSTSGFEATGRRASWQTVADGGWGQDGCHGTYEVMPSGGTSTDVLDQSAVWWFVPNEGTYCQVMVYVPKQSTATYRAAPSAQFSVLAGRSGQRFAQFVVDQSAKPGSWVKVGSYPNTSNGIAVLLASQGQTPSPGAMLAISQVEVSCTG